MGDSGVTGYPPARNTWEYPPPPVPTRWKWLAVAAGILGLGAAAAMTAVIATVGSQDLPGLIDDDQLTSTIAAECELMTRTVAALPLSGSTQRQAATIADQNQAVEIMVRSIRARSGDRVRDDRPAERWLEDWQLLVDARETYAAELVDDPRVELRVPVDPDGVPITVRMDDVWVGDAVCEVPRELSDPSTGLSGV